MVFLQVLWEDGEGGGFSRGGDSGGDREQQGWPVWWQYYRYLPLLSCCLIYRSAVSAAAIGAMAVLSLMEYGVVVSASSE